MRNGILACVVALGCASSERGGATQPIPEMQADVLETGVYEPFTHPDSLDNGSRFAAESESAATAIGEGDPETQELVGTLGGVGTYNDAPQGEWTLQLGAFGTETGALVRIQKLEAEFGNVPRWHVRSGDLYRVFLGRFADKSVAEAMRQRVSEAGYPDAWVTRAP